MRQNSIHLTHDLLKRHKTKGLSSKKPMHERKGHENQVRVIEFCSDKIADENQSFINITLGATGNPTFFFFLNKQDMLKKKHNIKDMTNTKQVWGQTRMEE